MKKLNYSILFIVAIMLVLVGVTIGTVFSFQGNAPNPGFKVKALSEDRGRTNRPEFVDNEILVKFKNDDKPFRVVSVPRGRVMAFIEIYENRNDVIYAEPNYIAYADVFPDDPPNDPYYYLQWNFYNPEYGGINMPPAWAMADGHGAVVAVLDTGINPGGEDTPNICSDPVGYDFYNSNDDPFDGNGHGTHVAGTIAQHTDNGVGVAGIAHNACVLPVKVLSEGGSGPYDVVADGIYYATDNGAEVINMSFGGTGNNITLENAVNYAYTHGVVVVAAAGNSGSNRPHYPASYDSVIAVGAVGYDLSLASYSTYGAAQELVAPGGDMYSEVYNKSGKVVREVEKDLNGDGYPDGILQETFDGRNFGYYFFEGTSMAAPHVSAVAALLVSAGVSHPAAVRQILQSTARDFGDDGWDPYYGYGLVDPVAALEMVSNPPDNDKDTYPATEDCNDYNSSIHPYADELMCDGIDNDCDYTSPDAIDSDRDGYSFQCDEPFHDCDDTDPSVNPGVLEIMCDGKDNDCDTSTLDALDYDKDGYSQCVGPLFDCNDYAPNINPGADEVCDDGVDNDCDSYIDEDCPASDPTSDCSACFKGVCDGKCTPKDKPGCPDCQ